MEFNTLGDLITMFWAFHFDECRIVFRRKVLQVGRAIASQSAISQHQTDQIFIALKQRIVLQNCSKTNNCLKELSFVSIKVLSVGYLLKFILSLRFPKTYYESIIFGFHKGNTHSEKVILPESNHYRTKYENKRITLSILILTKLLIKWVIM